MSMQDLLSDFVARVNNAVVAKRDTVEVLNSKLTVEVCKKLVKLNYFTKFAVNENYTISVEITPDKIHKLNRLSKPSRRMYGNYVKLPKVVGGKGWNILTTSKGVLTNFEAKTQQVGGELLFSIY